MNNLEKGRNYIAGGLATAMILTGLAGCNYVEANNNQPTITSSVPSPTEKPPIPTLIPTLEPTLTPTPEPTPTIAPTPTEVPPTPTPEKRANPSVLVKHGDRTKPEMAFTFDDSGEGLHKILNICNEKGIKATFFLSAGEISASPTIWQQAIKDGHQICNHGAFHYMDLGKRSEEEIKASILGWERVCKANLGEEYFNKMKKDFPYFRVPGGNYTPRFYQCLGDLGYTKTVHWTAEDCDSMVPENNKKNLTLPQYYNERVENGAIFLLHGGKAGYVAEIIDKVQAKGYKFKLVSEILD